MSTERFNRQFILLDFRDLDNPDYLAFVRSPEFSTYLLMRRYIWRSTQPHHMGLETLYQQGLLACSLDREKMAEQLGGVSIRTVTNDLTALERRGVIAIQHTGRQNIYVLGRWGEDDRVYYEAFFVDRLHLREEETFPSDEQGNDLPLRQEESFLSDVRPLFLPERQEPAAKNKEENREANREEFENSNRRLVDVLEARTILASYAEDFGREFRDEAVPAVSTARLLNLYLAAGLGLDDFITVMMAARRTTQARTATITKQAARGGTIGTKNKMPYFFTVLADLLGLKGDEDGASADEPTSRTRLDQRAQSSAGD